MTDIIPLSEKLYRTGMELAIQKKDYKNAILLLKLSKLDNWETLNNIGVCYERLHQYKKAAEYYLKSNCNIGRQNYVLLARYNKIDIDSNFYRICEELIKDGDVLGYTTFTDFYCRRKKFRDLGLALKYAEEGFKALPNHPTAIFNYAWCLYFCDQKEKSHEIYYLVVSNPSYEHEDVYGVAAHNYAYHFLKGIGCKKDISKSIYWFIKSFEAGYINSAKDLADIFYLEKSVKNEQLYNFWANKYQEARSKKH